MKVIVPGFDSISFSVKSSTSCKNTSQMKHWKYNFCTFPLDTYFLKVNSLPVLFYILFHEVTVSLSSAEVVKRIKNNEKYDIIFSNNIYRDGTGQECLAKLKEIEGFCTPVVIHTVTKNAKYHFVNEVGFDDYIEKPITQAKVLPILEKLLPLGGENDT